MRAIFRGTVLTALRSSTPLSIEEIYAEVARRHGGLCNDRVKRGNPPRPLWRHEVRFALNDLKESMEIDHVRDAEGRPRRGFWLARK